MARFDTTKLLSETIEHVKTLGIDEITFARGVHMSIYEFCELVQTLRLAEGDPLRISPVTYDIPQGGKYDFILITSKENEDTDQETERRVLHVRHPADPFLPMPLLNGIPLGDQDFFEVLKSSDVRLIRDYLMTRSVDDLRTFAMLKDFLTVAVAEVVKGKETADQLAETGVTP